MPFLTEDERLAWLARAREHEIMEGRQPCFQVACGQCLALDHPCSAECREEGLAWLHLHMGTECVVSAANVPLYADVA